MKTVKEHVEETEDLYCVVSQCLSAAPPPSNPPVQRGQPLTDVPRLHTPPPADLELQLEPPSSVRRGSVSQPSRDRSWAGLARKWEGDLSAAYRGRTLWLYRGVPCEALWCASAALVTAGRSMCQSATCVALQPTALDPHLLPPPPRLPPPEF
ncbi:unnamed protein product [Pleuronectes platessa]|uniref:Uncharacterized protein n=1 Tax=Pleuronectes platessa TaxID=8262 RepID=A0A9N7VR12_PLEPL|nr:unnamed protein product [Pleuronectes platessa]